MNVRLIVAQEALYEQMVDFYIGGNGLGRL